MTSAIVTRSGSGNASSNAQPSVSTAHQRVGNLAATAKTPNNNQRYSLAMSPSNKNIYIAEPREYVRYMLNTRGTSQSAKDPRSPSVSIFDRPPCRLRAFALAHLPFSPSPILRFNSTPSPPSPTVPNFQ